MYTIKDEAFEQFCFKRYERYIAVCELLGITEYGDFWSFKSHNIEWLEAEFYKSSDRTIH